MRLLLLMLLIMLALAGCEKQIHEVRAPADGGSLASARPAALPR